MDKSVLFKRAHKITKATVQAGDDYRATFGITLKIIFEGFKSAEKRAEQQKQARIKEAEQKRIARTAEARKTAKMLGGKALTGTAKQKAWAEDIRKNFLSLDLTDESISFVTSSQMTATAKFWIETRNINRQELATAMNDLVVATKKANEIGEGNEGYDEQLAIRAKALKILTV